MNKVFKRSIIFVNASVLFTLFVGLLIISIKIIRSRSSDNKNNIAEYRYFHFNPKTNESTSSILSSNVKDFNGRDYLTKTDRNGNLVLISNPELIPYIYYGSCNCHEKIFSIQQLLAAKDIDQAEKILSQNNEICQEKLPFCKTGSFELNKIDFMSGIPDNKYHEFKDFWCHGTCVPDERQASLALSEMAREYPCYHFFRGSIVRIYSVDRDLDTMLEIATRNFAQNNLYDYCYDVGKIMWERYEENDKGKMEYITTYEHLCYDGMDGEEKNPKLNCREK